MKIYLAQINPTIGDLTKNLAIIQENIQAARKLKAELIVFPELALCGYPPEDLLLYPDFIKAMEWGVEQVMGWTQNLTVILGCPRAQKIGDEWTLHNSAAILSNGKLVGFQDKTLLPTYDVFDERRYFEPGEKIHLWDFMGHKWAISICEDIWQDFPLIYGKKYQRSPLNEIAALKPDFHINISASPFSVNHFSKRLKVCEQAAQKTQCPTFYVNQVGGNDGLIFDGHSLFLDSSGHLLAIAKGFEEDYLLIDTAKNIPVLQRELEKKAGKASDEKIFQALVLGVRDYLLKNRLKKVCLGLSGGIDSAVVACLAVEALGKENVLGLALPGPYNSPDSLKDAETLATNLGLEFKIISISNPFDSYRDLLTPALPPTQSLKDTTEENLQARIRGMILMAFANRTGALLLNTGNKSEMAVGYCTLYGDMCGGLAVLSDVTKKQVYTLARYINRFKEVIPLNTIQRPPSAELKPDQKDSDSLPEYDVIDTIVENYLIHHKHPEDISLQEEIPLNIVQDIVGKIHFNEFKRRQAPMGLRISSKAFNIGRRFPIVQNWDHKKRGPTS